MLFICENCGKKRKAVFKRKDWDLYLCWTCLPKSSKHWHWQLDEELRRHKAHVRELDEIRSQQSGPIKEKFSTSEDEAPLDS